MNDRERFLSVLNFEQPDVFPFMEFMGFWPEVLTRWREEGLGNSEDIFEHFGLLQYQTIPIDFNFIPPFEEIVVHETEHHITIVDELGCTKKMEKNSSAMPEYIDFPVKGRKDFVAIKERMNALDTDRRYPPDWETLVGEYKRRSYPLGLVIRGPFAFCRDFMKFEHLMLMVYDDISLIRDMMNFQVDFTIDLWGKAVQDVDVDFVSLGEDMACKSGLMFSPSMCDELVRPCYRTLTSFFRDNGVKNILLDSDGNVDKLIPMYIESGITGIWPLENTAGMNPIAIRQEYPQLQMIGGINKLNIAEGGSHIDIEIEKAKTLMRLGGYIPSFDHSVPPIVSYQNYSTYIEQLRNAG